MQLIRQSALRPVMECNKKSCTLALHLWFKRNKRLKQHTLRPPEIILKEVIKDISLSYRSEWYRKSCCQVLGISAMQLWETTLSYFNTRCHSHIGKCRWVYLSPPLFLIFISPFYTQGGLGHCPFIINGEKITFIENNRKKQLTLMAIYLTNTRL